MAREPVEAGREIDPVDPVPEDDLLPKAAALELALDGCRWPMGESSTTTSAAKLGR